MTTRTRLAPALALLAFSASLLAQGPVISEFMARNASTHRDSRNGKLYDWIEIHNPTQEAIRLGGHYLTDDPADRTKWRIPHAIVQPGGYELIYASGEGWTISGQTYHTEFKLDGDGEYLALIDSNGDKILHEYSGLAQQWPDMSYGLAGGNGTPGYIETPTPGGPNGAVTYPAVTEQVESDTPRGQRHVAFQLALSSDTVGASIRFTVDGSEPTRTDGTLYTGPFTISSSTVIRAVAFTPGHATSDCATYTYLFYSDMATQSASPAGWPAVWGSFDAPWGPYTRIADYGMDASIAQSPTYGPMLLNSFESLPAISIAMDPSDLFDDQTGIYDNPGVRGEIAERPASVEFLYPRMGRDQQTDVGIKIHGRGGRRGWINAKFSFRLLFKENYGATDLDANLFGLDAVDEHNTIVLRTIYNDSFLGGLLPTYVRDMFVRDTQAEIGHSSAHGSYCHLFLNGLYWGLYNPSERPDAAFQAAYYGGKRGDYDVLKHFGGVVMDGDRVAYDAAKSIANAGLTSTAAYDAIREYIDVENLADYMLVNMFCVNADWPDNNWYMARRREPGAGFRFYCWDAEFALRLADYDMVNVVSNDGPAFFYDRLRANAEFRTLLADRARALMFGDGPLSTQRCIERFGRRAVQVRSAVVAESARWGDYATVPPFSLADWDATVAYELSQFFPQRPTHMLAQLRAAGLYPTVDAPEFSQPGGIVSYRSAVSIATPSAAGQILFTTDGRDPRLVGGGIAPTAMPYSSPIYIHETTVIHARTRSASGEWSALNVTTFRPSGLVVQEVLAANVAGITDPAGEHDDWIELYNPTDRTLDAGGLFLTDKRERPTKWQIPAGQVVPPGGTLLVWADEDGSQPGLHANFKLSASGEEVHLFDRDGTTRLDGFRFGPQADDVSIGWLDDGGASHTLVTFPEPTPGASNETIVTRRLFSGRAHDQHTIRLDARPIAGVGTSLALTIEHARPNGTVMLLASTGSAYQHVFGAASEIALLLDVSALSVTALSAGSDGSVTLPLGPLGGSSSLGVSLFFQTFTIGSEGVRGSNAVELLL